MIVFVKYYWFEYGNGDAAEKCIVGVISEEQFYKEKPGEKFYCYDGPFVIDGEVKK